MRPCSTSCWRSRAPAARARPRSRCCDRICCSSTSTARRSASAMPRRSTASSPSGARPARRPRIPTEVAAFFGTHERRDRFERDRAARAARRRGHGPRSPAAVPRGAIARRRRSNAISGFLREFHRDDTAGDAWQDRHLRARAAVLGVLDGLADAFRRHDDEAREPEELVAAIHHALEGRTFTPRRGRTGVHLVDAVAARFARARSRVSRRPGRHRLARAPAAEHLLRERAAQGARMAAGGRSDAGAAGGVPRSAAAGRRARSSSTPSSSRATPSSACRRWSTPRAISPLAKRPTRPRPRCLPTRC